MKLSKVVVMLASVGSSTSQFLPAKRMSPSIDIRSSFYGGWPIAADTCPSNTHSCDDGSCCPTSSSCYTDGLAGVAVCCPNTNNCVDTLNTLPVCADPSWNLYIGNYNYFCCASDQVGVLPDKGSSVAAGLCVESNVNPAASILATPYQTATPSAAATSSTATSSTIPSSAQASVLSTSVSSTAKPSSTSNSSPASVPSSLSAKLSSPPAAASTSFSSPSSSPSEGQSSVSRHHPKSKNVPIIGGVVGGVVVLAIIAFAIWFFGLRRRKMKATATSEPYYASPPGPAEKDGIQYNPVCTEAPGEMAGNFGVSEVPVNDIPAKRKYFKSASTPATELP